jgi:hypothetical protein
VKIQHYSLTSTVLRNVGHGLKSRIRKQLRDATPLREAMETVLKQAAS